MSVRGGDLHYDTKVHKFLHTWGHLNSFGIIWRKVMWNRKSFICGNKLWPAHTNIWNMDREGQGTHSFKRQKLSELQGIRLQWWWRPQGTVIFTHLSGITFVSPHDSGGHKSSHLCCTEKSNAGSSYRSPMKNLKVILMGSCSCAKQSSSKSHSIRNSYCRRKKSTLRNNHIKQEVAVEHWQQRAFSRLKNCKMYPGRAEWWIANLEITQVYSLYKLILWFHEAI